MAEQIITDFHEHLAKRAKYGVAGEKPIFLMSVLRYMVRKNAFGKSLVDMLHPRHRLRMKNDFLYLAGLGQKLIAPYQSWDKVAGSRNFEMKGAIEKYLSRTSDVSVAFSKLKKKNAETLLSRFLESLKEYASSVHEDVP